VTSLEAQQLPRFVAHVFIPISIEVIQNHAFADCHWLRAINFAPDAMLLELSGFQACGITCITIPTLVEIVTETAFADCLALDIVRFTGDLRLCQIDGFRRSPIRELIGREGDRLLGFSTLSIFAAREVYSGKPASYN
jgi:hypothetical protein